MAATTNKLSKEQIEQLKNLAEQGYMDSEIADILGNVTRGAVWYQRKRLGIKTKFTYDKISTLHYDEVKNLAESGLSDYKIAEILGVKACSVFSYRKRHGIKTRNKKYNESIPLTDFQKEVLIGTLMGDGSMRKTNVNPSFVCAHCLKQKEYTEYKVKIFESLNPHYYYSKRQTPDKRNGLYYEAVTFKLPANPEFLRFYNSFYPNGKKVLPIDLLPEYTAVSLAFHFMDDGYKMKNGYALATNCFSIDELTVFRKFLLDRFGIISSIWESSHCIYIHKESRKLFKSLIKPYICDCMRYKL